MKYKFVFVAYSATAIPDLSNPTEGDYFAIDPSSKILTVRYDKIAKAQNEASDLFYTKIDHQFDASGEVKPVTLKRVMAQLNVGSTTEDLAVATNSGINTNTMQTGYVLTGIPNQLSLLDGNVSGTENITLVPATRPSETLTVSETDYKWVSTAYVLMGTTGQTTDVTLNVNMANMGGEQLTSISRSITAVPLKRNYRTNILGNIFSIDAMFNVSVDSDFTDNTNKIIGPSYASVAALNAYFETFENNADNGDVDPEIVTLTAIPETDPTIVLPRTDENILLRIPVTYDGTLTIKYNDEAASNTEKPANLYLYVTSLTKLVADITSTHVELMEGSVISDQAEVHTSDGTFVIRPTAKVGKLYVHQGNAEIAGTVDEVDVIGTATADGNNHPVQVFVAKEAAIQTITLNAKSDVVVEQPKDNIEVSSSDNKVVVIVNAAGSSATAQNGGEIYVKANANCVVNAINDQKHAGITTTVNVTEVATGVNVASVEENGGDVTSDSDAVKDIYVAKINSTLYENLSTAFSNAADGDIVELLKDYSATNEAMYDNYRNLGIDKSITVEGKGHALTVKDRGIAVGAKASSNIDVTFKDIDILNSTYSARCIDTRGHIGTLTLDGVSLNTQGATGQYTQPLTIGGNQSDFATVNISNSTIKTNDDATAYYAIITFNPVKMNISSSTIKGWACIYAKGQDSSAGSAGSVFTIDNCALESTNEYSGTTNAFAAFVSNDDNVTFNVTNSSLSINGKGDQEQAIVYTPNNNVVTNLGSGNNVTLTGKGTFKRNQAKLNITGGTFNEDPSKYVVEGYIARESGDATWVVEDGTHLTFTEFNNMVVAKDGVYDGTGKNVVVTLSASERNVRNNNTAQFYLGKGTGNKTNGIETVSVKGVTFTYNHDADDGNTTLNTGEVYATAMDITVEDCTFTNNAGLSSWGYLGDAQNPPQSMVVKNCIFKELTGRYAVHQNRAKNLTVEGCSFVNCERGIHTNSPTPASIIVKNNTFSGISESKGVLCLAEDMSDIASADVQVTGNSAPGQAMLRSLNASATAEQIIAIRDNNEFGMLYVDGSTYKPIE